MYIDKGAFYKANKQRNSMRNVILIMLMLISNNVLAQESPAQDSERRLGVNVNVLGPTILLSVSVDYFVTPKTNVELGTGVIGIYGGVKYHWNRNQSESGWTPYAGLDLTFIPEICFISCAPARIGLYIPVGMQFMSNGGFTFGAEIAGLILDNTKTPLWGALKLGYHF